ncbi:MAG: glycosyltransferase family 39 protein, partial [Anaerolineales bacterium]|nr:glycosyltransferase family 39 protein [Anaerolineales bacterium]
MAPSFKKEWFVPLLSLALFLFYCWGILLVPFHPDESTQIYMSGDFSQYLKNPFTLAVSPGVELTQDVIYRALDAPITRYLIGIARGITNTPKLPVDWNWKLDWQNNQSAGAFPDPSLLLVSRFIPVLLLPLSINLLYFALRKILSQGSAVIAVLYLGLNPLLLLHGRRAMAESALLFGITLFLWAVTRKKVNPILVGLSLAVAFNAKQTAAVLIPAGIIAVCLIEQESRNLKNLLTRTCLFLVVFLAICILLNPFYWKSPILAISISVQAREQLSHLQLIDHLGGVKPSPLALFYELLNNLFMSPPIPLELGYYSALQDSPIQEYFSIPPHSWGRGLFAGSMFITISLGGIIVLVKRFRSYIDDKKRILTNLIFITLLLIGGIIFTLPIPWQRYIIPLLPLSAFWFAYGCLPFIDFANHIFMTLKGDLS